MYASNNQKSYCFHRTIFVFICRNSTCSTPNDSSNIRVFRSQLPRNNPYYSSNPPDESIKSDPIPSPVNLCRVCGCRGPSTCSRCKQVFYCSATHQKLDWKHRHKLECMEGANPTEHSSEILFPEYDLVMETEEFDESKSNDDEEAEKRRLKEYEELLKAGKAGNLIDVSDTDLEQYGDGDTGEDKTFAKFKKRIAGNPDQVLRYERDGSPLWIAFSHKLASDAIPVCDNCQGARTFEFQIMPQLLNNLKQDELDWGVICIYTCSSDCDIGNRYIEEYAYKQDLLKEDENS